jgi:hypothetical protein
LPVHNIIKKSFFLEKVPKRWYSVGLVLGVANVFAFMIGTVLLGGDALNGHASGGHFFLDDKGHLTEVSRSVFLYSRWHAYSLVVTQPIGIACAGLLVASRYTKRTTN